MNAQLHLPPTEEVEVVEIDFTKLTPEGAIILIAQNAASAAHEVLLAAFTNREAFEAMIRTGKLHYFSRTRGVVMKGATSGNTFSVLEIRTDCDRDSVLVMVTPDTAGTVMCHLESHTCFAFDVVQSRRVQRIPKAPEMRHPTARLPVAVTNKSLLRRRREASSVSAST